MLVLIICNYRRRIRLRLPVSEDNVSMNPTEQEVLNWIAAVFEESPEGITRETPREQIPKWDSLGVLMLMSDMDEKFGILLEEEDLRSMNRVEDVFEVLKRHGKL